MSNIAAALAALADELADESPAIVFSEAIPTTFTAPAVVVAPSDPFITPATIGNGGLVTETWDVLVVVNFTDKAAGLAQLRDLSLRVRRAVTGVGAAWRRASGPRVRDGETNRNFIVSVNTVEVTYNPHTHLQGES